MKQEDYDAALMTDVDWDLSFAGLEAEMQKDAIEKGQNRPGNAD